MAETVLPSECCAPAQIPGSAAVLCQSFSKAAAAYIFTDG